MPNNSPDMLPAPAAYGLPAKYSTWRPYQESAVARALGTDKEYVAIVAPTGFGKSVTAEVIAAFLGRSVYVVGTHQLANQIGREFAHRADVRGKGTYDCLLLQENGYSGAEAKCDKAEFLCESCSYKDRGCLYYDRWRRAKVAQHVITNYSYWLYINKYNEEGIGEFDVGIFDEAHSAADQMSDFLRVELSGSHVERFSKQELPRHTGILEWRDWAANQLYTLRPRLESLQSQQRIEGKPRPEVKPLKLYVGQLDDLAAASGDWVIDRRADGKQASFEPIWPAPYAWRLFAGVKKKVLMSATIRPKTLELLGVPMDRVEFLEFPSSFPVDRRPVIHIPTVQQRYNMPEDKKIEAVRRVDQLVRNRLDRKGIIHTVSFDRAKYIMSHSAFAGYMMTAKAQFGGGSAEVAAIIEQFEHAQPPRVLTTPNVGTGFDFPGSQCEYIIIYKLPFRDQSSPVEKARQKADDKYGLFAMIIDLIQYLGRGMRSQFDRCEGLVIDDMMTWAYPQCVNLGFVPGWFQPAVRLRQLIPKAPEKLMIMGGTD